MAIPPPTKKEEECIQFLKEKYPADKWLDPEDKAFLDGSTYLRFARARDGDKNKASEMLMAALEWRKSYKPYQIKAEEIEEAMQQLTLTCGGRCCANRPLLVMTLAVPNACKGDVRTKQLVYILEQTQKKGYDSISWIVDFGEMGKHPKDPESKATRKDTMQILQDYYPERLGLMLLYRTPWYIRWSINLVKPFLNVRTRRRIFIAGQKLADLSAYVDSSQIPVRMGGTFPSDGLHALEDLPPFDYDDKGVYPEKAEPPTNNAFGGDSIEKDDVAVNEE